MRPLSEDAMYIQAMHRIKIYFLGQSLSVFSPFLLHINPFTSCFIWVVPSILVICMSDLWEPEGPLNTVPWIYGLVQSGLSSGCFCIVRFVLVRS